MFEITDVLIQYIIASSTWLLSLRKFLFTVVQENRMDFLPFTSSFRVGVGFGLTT